MNVSNVMSQHAEIQDALIAMLDDEFNGKGHIEYADYFDDEQLWEVQYFDGETVQEVIVTTVALEKWMHNNK
ncbi:hypothetical protein [Vibrio phage XZ1]|uniref:Uncharacterized protein n=1 Tax=Vibrio phage VH7D TaxID=1262539 RepID=V9LZ95_9CAUD|nr:hypothetical protein CF80_gp054 [Vibrio phage VH7D]ALP47669.1 hypothetical protein phiST2_0037 [Vibrio phage phi-ST2]QBX06305.1 hypothetical protein Va3_352 [Vibrio phage Va3]QNJ54933.1 hypothetical protein vBValMR11Z_7 [Vibrio phage vB_ValM_R11Z]UOL51362.1 hypothetical protein [Vibrio phage XZ1]URQ03751.1 hypothetical protein PVA23_374 [Vibrio phage PVA23]